VYARVLIKEAEDRKDNRIKEQAVAQSKLIAQRKGDTSPTPILDDTDFNYNGNSTGTLFVTATANTMQTIDGGMYVYGLQSNDAGTVKTWLYGLFTVNEDVVD
jgi:hypothetical protein